MTKDTKKPVVVLPMQPNDQAVQCLTAATRLSSVGELATGLAHELNNTIGIILGFAHYWREHESNPEAVQASVKTIEREALRCKRLVQDLLTYSRHTRPGKVMEDFPQILDATLSLVESRARIQEVEVRREFDDHLPLVYMDRHRVQQLILNLCNNALDAMPSGGVLTIRLRHPLLAQESGEVELQVIDTGPGISPDIQDHIFDPFFTTKPAGKGTGLGLSLVKEIARDHNATVSVGPMVHKGACFSVVFHPQARPRAVVGESGRGLSETKGLEPNRAPSRLNRVQF